MEIIQGLGLLVTMEACPECVVIEMIIPSVYLKYIKPLTIDVFMRVRCYNMES